MTKCYRGFDDKGVAYSGVRDVDQRGMSPGYTRLVAEHRGRFVYWEVLTHTLEEIDASEGIDVSKSLARLAAFVEPSALKGTPNA